MTERERLAADVRRLEWLADATLGPARIECAAHTPAAARQQRPDLPIGIWQRGLSSARVLGQRVRLLRPGTSEPLPRPNPAPIR